MKPTPEQIAAGLAASYDLRERGIPERGIKPISFTGNPSLHVEAIGVAMLELVPETAIPAAPEKSKNSPRPRRAKP